MWLLQVALYAALAATVGILFYREFLSPTHRRQREEKQRTARRRFERRSIERPDRRQRDEGPPDGVERRKGSRRSGDR